MLFFGYWNEFDWNEADVVCSALLYFTFSLSVIQLA